MNSIPTAEALRRGDSQRHAVFSSFAQSPSAPLRLCGGHRLVCPKADMPRRELEYFFGALRFHAPAVPGWVGHSAGALKPPALFPAGRTDRRADRRAGLCADVVLLAEDAGGAAGDGGDGAVTGAFHEDWADMVDGFGGGTSRERTLEIMKDSRIGSYGAIALVR